MKHHIPHRALYLNGRATLRHARPKMQYWVEATEDLAPAWVSFSDGPRKPRITVAWPRELPQWAYHPVFYNAAGERVPAPKKE